MLQLSQLNEEILQSLFSVKSKRLDKLHFTPISVATQAAKFLLSGDGLRILDIGSGNGKFCFVAALLNPHAQITGIEQREELISEAQRIQQKLHIKNINFIHQNIDKVNFVDYDHFYFFNAFHEQLSEEKMDDEILHDQTLYHYYNRYLYKQFKQLKRGTRLATFFTENEIIPPDFLLIDSLFDQTLHLYEKI